MTAAWVYGGVYAFVAFVAFATSGPAVFEDPLLCYGTIAPLGFAGYCGWTGFRRPSSRRMLPGGMIAHVLAAPALVWSLLGLGIGMVVLSFLWWRLFLDVRREEARP